MKVAAGCDAALVEAACEAPFAAAVAGAVCSLRVAVGGGTGCGANVIGVGTMPGPKPPASSLKPPPFDPCALPMLPSTVSDGPGTTSAKPLQH